MGKINYILQLNAFWERRKTHRIKSSSGDLYCYLLSRNNKYKWIKKFTVDYESAIQTLSISKNTFYSCIKELVDTGYIAFEKSENPVFCGKISIAILYQNLGNDLVNDADTSLETNNETSEYTSLETFSTLSKHINNETLNTETTTNSEVAAVAAVDYDFVFSFFKTSIARRQSSEKYGLTPEQVDVKFKEFFELKNDLREFLNKNEIDIVKHFILWLPKNLKGEKQQNTPTKNQNNYGSQKLRPGGNEPSKGWGNGKIQTR